jgi:hypothetical protein
MTRSLNYTDLFGENDLETFARIDDLDLYTPPSDFDIQVFTNNYAGSTSCGDYVSAKFDRPTNKVETATLVLKGNDPLVDMVMQCYETVVPITISNGGQRVWWGRVDTFDDAIVNGVNTVTCQLIGDWNWNNKVMCWPAFFEPIEAQFPTRALYIGPAISCILFMWATQAFRLQSGIWELINNITDPEAWFGTAEMGQDLLTPVAVNWVDPLVDTSKWVSYSGRMDNLATLVEQILKDNGLLLSIDLWLKGEPQPITGVTLTGNAHMVVNCKDMSGITGLTGTFLDGALFDLLDLENSVLGDTLNPFLNPNNNYAPEGVNIAPTLGINFTPPWVVFNADAYRNGGIVEMHFNGHHPLAYTVIGGGKSPKVGAPPGNWGGTGPRVLKVDERSRQRNARVFRGCTADRGFILRDPKQCARRDIRRRAPGLPGSRELRPQSETRSVRLPGVLRFDGQLGLHARHVLRAPIGDVGQPWLPLCPNHGEQRIPVSAGCGCVPRAASVPGSTRVRLHRLPRRLQRSRRPQDPRQDHLHDRRRDRARVASCQAAEACCWIRGRHQHHHDVDELRRRQCL